MNDFELRNKTIVVTGSSSGIGKEICLTIAKLGANVMMIGRNIEKLNIVKSQLNQKLQQNHSVFQFDLLEIDNIESLISNLPPIDGIVHCAGMAKYMPYKFIKREDLREINIINYEAPVLITQGLLKAKKLIKGSSIVFISSISGLIGTFGSTIYSGSKGALISSTRTLALEVANLKIRANCISPGIILTELTDGIEKLVSKETFIQKEQLYPLGFGTTQDVANGVVFLLSDASRWITGINLIIDGGFTSQ